MAKKLKGFVFTVPKTGMCIITVGRFNKKKEMTFKVVKFEERPLEKKDCNG